jgi:hypothetical protein
MADSEVSTDEGATNVAHEPEDEGAAGDDEDERPAHQIAPGSTIAGWPVLLCPRTFYTDLNVLFCKGIA